MHTSWFRSFEFLLLLILLALMAVMSMTSPAFLKWDNLFLITQQMSELGIIALGMTLVILTAGIDLSVSSIVGLSAITIGYLSFQGVNIWVAVLAGLLVAVLCGAFNAVFIARIGVSPILVTLGTMSLFQGIALYVTKGNAFSDFPAVYNVIGLGYVGPFPVQFLIFASLAIVLAIALKRTAWGRSIYLIGGNRVAARFSGINHRKVLFRVYLLVGLLCGIAAVIISSRVNTARPDLGSSYLLQSIAAVVLGGTMLTGGKGNIFGTVMGVSIFAVLSNGLNLNGVSPFVQTVLMGAILIVVLVIRFYTQKLSQKREKHNHASKQLTA